METKEMHFFKYLLLYLNLGVFFTTTLLTYPDLSYCEAKSTTDQAKTIAIICDISTNFSKDNDKNNERLNTDDISDCLCDRVTHNVFYLRKLVMRELEIVPYKVLDRENIVHLLKEKGYVISGIAKNSEARKLIKFSGADLVLFCKLRFFFDGYTGDRIREVSASHVFKLVDVNSGMVEHMSSRTFSISKKVDILSLLKKGLDWSAFYFMVGYLHEIKTEGAMELIKNELKYMDPGSK